MVWQTLQIIGKVWKVFKHSGKCSDNLKGFGALWKLSTTLENFGTLGNSKKYSGYFTENLNIFLKHWTVCKPSGKCVDILESLGIFWRVYGRSEKFPDTLVSL